ncbi:S9 family peptidase [Brachybacterium sp. NBEC-018]|uniref:alpha/beta hydrolase family protein n=1 Tax=Brachybacterium sp. NBEC-018 TaxID=2996004 RepID=UPI00217553B2|nr:S9 family peptidase [Brachybacterium sp. NBEC-018]UVY84607.1 S9 family peptidase [Brachybacterium sp. NBEC-018]
MELTDIDLLTTLSRPSLSPDGSFVVYATSRPDLRADRAVGQLWRLDLEAPGDPEPRRLTRGIADSAPQLSPDASTIAFLRPDDRGARQLHLLDARGGEPLRITDRPLGVQAFSWLPDGGRLALLSREPEPGRYGTVEGLGPAAEPPRRITGIRWHANGTGYTVDRPTQVLLVEAADPAGEPAYPAAPHPSRPTGATPAVPHPPVALTDSPAEHSALAVTADGAAVVVARTAYESDRRDHRTELLSLPVDGSAPTVLLTREDGLAVLASAVAADGTIAVLASAPEGGRYEVAPDVSLWLLEEGGPRRITDAETLDVASAGPELLPLGEDLLLRSASRGRVRLLRVGRDGTVRPLVDGDVAVRAVAAVTAPEGERILAMLAAPDTPGRLVAVDPDGAGAPPRTLLDTGGALRAAGLVLPQEIEVAGSDGYPVHGWVTTPPGDGPFPTLLMIHGGPYAAYDVAVLDEVQVLVGAGYAVVHGNPRGSAGYGRAHGRAVRRAFGTVDQQDVLTLLEGALAADPRLDAERLGIMGGSYGGYLTAWTIAHDHRFRGAIVERGFLDPLSFQGTSDIGTSFGDAYIGTSPEDIARQSAFDAAASVRTPTLVIHAERDLRCPLEQGTRYYSALRRAGVEAELLIFPGEDHELSRSGRPRHRAERFEAVLEWWSRHLAV